MTVATSRACRCWSLPKNADSQAILRAYRNKLRDNKGNDAAIERIEAAHTSILMRGLSSRLSVIPVYLCCLCLASSQVALANTACCACSRAERRWLLM